MNTITDANRQTADDALRMGVLTLHDTGLTFVAPALLDLADADRPRAERVARRVLDRTASVFAAARRLVAAHWHRPSA